LQKFDENQSIHSQVIVWKSELMIKEQTDRHSTQQKVSHNTPPLRVVLRYKMEL